MERIRIFENGTQIDTKPGAHQGGDWLAPARHGYDPFTFDNYEVLRQWGALASGMDQSLSMISAVGMVESWNRRKKTHRN